MSILNIQEKTPITDISVLDRRHTEAISFFAEALDDPKAHRILTRFKKYKRTACEKPV
jgi:hypothetical protein